MVASRKSGRIYLALRREIVLGALEPGAGLAEIALARRFEASQVTAREALMRLQEDGLVSRDGYRGTSVTDMALDAAEELLHVRVHLEGAAARRVAPLFTDDLEAEFAGIIDRMAAAADSDDLYGAIESDHHFHLSLFALANMPVLTPILSRCILHMHRLAFAKAGPPGSLPRSVKRHEPLLEAYASRDPAKAERAIRDHIEVVWRTALDRLERVSA